MTYRIAYFLDGIKILAVPSPKSLEETASAAKIGLARYGADEARILDMDSKTVVQTVRRNS